MLQASSMSGGWSTRYGTRSTWRDSVGCLDGPSGLDEINADDRKAPLDAWNDTAWEPRRRECSDGRMGRRRAVPIARP